MGFFGQAKDVMKLRSEAKKIEKELQGIHIEAEEAGVSIVMNAKQELISVTISDEITDHRLIEKNLVTALNRATKKSQQVGAEKMQSVMGGLQGLMGGGQ